MKTRRQAMIDVLSSAATDALNYPGRDRGCDPAVDWAADRLAEELYGRAAQLRTEEKIAEIDAREESGKP